MNQIGWLLRATVIASLCAASVACSDKDGRDRPDESRARFGVEINPRGSGADPLLVESYQEIAQAGVPLAQVSLAWTEVEPRVGAQFWEVLDRHLRNARERDLDLSVQFLLVDNQAPGSIPADLLGLWLADEMFQRRCAGFVRDLVARGTGHIRYVWIGRESDAYFAQNLGEVAAFEDLMGACIDSLQSLGADVELGTTLAYAEAAEAGRLALAERLGRAGQVVGLSVFGRSSRYEQTLSPGSTLARLNDGVEAFPDRPVVITETGYPGGGSSDPEKESFARLLTEYLDHAPPGLEAAFWSPLHDFSPSQAETRSLELYSGETERQHNYGEQLQVLGLKQVTGAATLAWLHVRDWSRERPLTEPSTLLARPRWPTVTFLVPAAPLVPKDPAAGRTSERTPDDL